MPNPLSQQDRIGKLTTPAGEDTFVLHRFEATEGMGSLFEYRIGALSLEDNFNFDSLIGLNCNVSIKSADGLERNFNGVLVDGNFTGAIHGLFGYQFVLRPWLHLLSRASDCRFFKEMDVLEIIKKVCSDRGFTDFRDDTSESYPKGSYVTQYRETDLNFVCRLMEEFGIYYYFEHTNSKHTLVFCDGPSNHKPVPGLKPVPLLPVTVESRRDRQQFDTWSSARAFQTGKDAINSYWYGKPTADNLGQVDKHGAYAHGSLETYDYDTTFKAKSWSEKYAKARIESVQALDDHRNATGSAASLFPGGKLTTEEVAPEGDNKEWIVLRCTHSYVDQSYISGGAGATSAYVGTYELMDSGRQYRSLLLTRRPSVGGWQSALVVPDKGNESEEIDVDKWGRILLKFYWDRKKELTRRVRVAQFWAGKDRGAWFCPRIGDEVLVAFEDGDPDHPIVIGSVYNHDNNVPMPLPSKKNQSGILTKSTKNSDGYHMLMFDDTKDQERIKLRSQKDLMFKALNNEQRDILMSQTENVGKDETINVGMDMAHDMSKGGGNWLLNAFKTATINVGPSGMPMTQIKMTQTDITITFFLGPIPFSQTVLDASGIKNTVMMGLTQHAWGPASTALMSPMISETALAAISMMAPAGVQAATNLQTPALVAGGAIIGGVPI